MSIPQGSIPQYYNNNVAPGYGNMFSQQQQQQQQQQPQIQVWMGELDPWWDEMAIRQIWQAVGISDTISSIKIIRDKNAMANGLNNSGYCFLRVNTVDDAQQILSHHGAVVPNTNKFFKLNWASQGNPQFSGRLQPTHQSIGPEFTIFVGDLPQGINESQLLEFFNARYQSCYNARVMVDPNTGNPRGYGFVKFGDEAEQQRALIEMQGAVLNGRPIRVSTAVKNSTNPVSNQHQMNSQFQKIVIPPQQFVPPLQQFSDPNNTTVFIGGLNSYVSVDELRHYFERFGEISYVKIPPGKNCGFVQYLLRSSAEKAITEMQGYPIGQSRIRVSWGARAAQRSHYQQQQQRMAVIGNQLPGGLMNMEQDGQFGPALSNPDFQAQQQMLAEQIPFTPGGVPTNEKILNEMYLAARDGQLDRLELDSKGYE
ncbi:unnamed protein product [Kuraishia capsulata CBS 1993]|uniref:RRM domain-containing protein n=1 Tax=Kuraishia capsulata CBS 1993 TaxID=1382522 RepID=W6MH59_9ASCO|nr:uncharacterized protein KUCA_T00000945001 [Kuraishia capsulata CBS 1993]CDK24978.1 unnamed protein product [Kuraishia capsulata CBS 1993]